MCYLVGIHTCSFSITHYNPVSHIYTVNSLYFFYLPRDNLKHTMWKWYFECFFTKASNIRFRIFFTFQTVEHNANIFIPQLVQYVLLCRGTREDCHCHWRDHNKCVIKHTQGRGCGQRGYPLSAAF